MSYQCPVCGKKKIENCVCISESERENALVEYIQKLEEESVKKDLTIERLKRKIEKIIQEKRTISAKFIGMVRMAKRMRGEKV